MNLRKLFGLPGSDATRNLHLNWFTLSFPSETEKQFQQKHFDDTIAQFRVSFILVTVVYESFGFLDSRINPQYQDLFRFIRYGIVLPGLGMMIIFSAGYFFIKLRFYMATLGGWIILIFFNICALTTIRIDSEMLLINDFFFVATNLIGMFAAYHMEYTSGDSPRY